MPMTIAAVAGFFVSISALDDPTGTVAAMVFTFVPITAPFVVPVRAALDDIPGWQYTVSMALSAGFSSSSRSSERAHLRRWHARVRLQSEMAGGLAVGHGLKWSPQELEGHFTTTR